MSTISFKNVGIKTSTKKTLENERRTLPPLGIMTPVREGTGTDGIFKMHRDPAAWIKDNLKNLILTNRGDRVIAADFGANLLPLAMESLVQDDFDNEAVVRIKTAVDRYMPYVQLSEFTSQIVKDELGEGLGRVEIIITYDVKSTDIKNQAVKVSFYLGG
jgi:phage baseplate assembly protein W